MAEIQSYNIIADDDRDILNQGSISHVIQYFNKLENKGKNITYNKNKKQENNKYSINNLYFFIKLSIFIILFMIISDFVNLS